MDFEKDYLDEKEPFDVEEEFEKPELTKGATRDTDPQYFTNIDGIYAKDAAGRAAVEELRTLVTGYSETVLWENEGTTAPDTIALSAAYTNFDAICVLCFTSANLYSSVIFLTSLLSLNAAYRFYWNYNEYIEYILSTATMLTLNNVKAGMYPKKIVGIKYGSNGGAVANALNANIQQTEEPTDEMR